MKNRPFLASLAYQLTHRKTTTCIWLFHVTELKWAVLDFARLPISQVDQMIKVTPLQVFFFLKLWTRLSCALSL